MYNTISLRWFSFSGHPVYGFLRGWASNRVRYGLYLCRLVECASDSLRQCPPIRLWREIYKASENDDDNGLIRKSAIRVFLLPRTRPQTPKFTRLSAKYDIQPPSFKIVMTHGQISVLA